MHHICRHPLLPWAQLRISTHSPHSYRLHTHAEYSLGLVDAGHARFVHGEHNDPLQAGDVVMIEPHVWHACNPSPNAPWSYRMLYLNADWLHGVLQLPSIAFARRKWRDAQLRSGLATLCAHLQAGQASAFETQLKALLVASDMVRAMPSPATLTPPPSAHPIEQAIHQLHQAPDAPVSVAALARSVGLSVSHFIRAFKLHTGVTPAAYRLNARLQGARELLAQGAALSDAAVSMGFADQAHLQRSFKAHHAMTPGQYAAARAPRHKS